MVCQGHWGTLSGGCTLKVVERRTGIRKGTVSPGMLCIYHFRETPSITQLQWLIHLGGGLKLGPKRAVELWPLYKQMADSLVWLLDVRTEQDGAVNHLCSQEGQFHM